MYFQARFFSIYRYWSMTKISKPREAVTNKTGLFKSTKCKAKHQPNNFLYIASKRKILKKIVEAEKNEVQCTLIISKPTFEWYLYHLCAITCKPFIIQKCVTFVFFIVRTWYAEAFTTSVIALCTSFQCRIKKSNMMKSSWSNLHYFEIA